MTPAPKPTFREALRFWAWLGCISFGGPTGQIAIMHQEVVERKKWVEENRFLNALNYCMLLPGPEAQQLATYLGWTLHGIRGGISAGLLFILPATFLLWLLSVLYVLYGTVPIVAAAFHGLVPAVIAIVFEAMLKLARKTLRDRLRWGIALGAALLVTFWRESYPLAILLAAFLAWIFRPASPARENSETPPESIRSVSFSGQFRVALICFAIWMTPLACVGIFLGWSSTPAQEGIFFSKAALVTFGGAYAVLPYVAQHAVESYHWLSPEQMMHGFGLAETTPGPLIIVLQFVGFLGGWHHAGSLSPLAAATLGAFITTWVTFAPSFLFILTGAPYVDRLIHITPIQAALGGVAAAVVGVIGQFAIWFAWHAIFPSGQLTHPDWFTVVVGIGAWAVLRFKYLEIAPLIGICAVLGMIYHAL